MIYVDAFKNFQNTIPSTRNLNFWFISIGSDFSKSETVLGQILQSVCASIKLKDQEAFWPRVFADAVLGTAYLLFLF